MCVYNDNTPTHPHTHNQITLYGLSQPTPGSQHAVNAKQLPQWVLLEGPQGSSGRLCVQRGGHSRRRGSLHDNEGDSGVYGGGHQGTRQVMGGWDGGWVVHGTTSHVKVMGPCVGHPTTLRMGAPIDTQGIYAAHAKVCCVGLWCCAVFAVCCVHTCTAQPHNTHVPSTTPHTHQVACVVHTQATRTKNPHTKKTRTHFDIHQWLPGGAYNNNNDNNDNNVDENDTHDDVASVTDSDGDDGEGRRCVCTVHARQSSRMQYAQYEVRDFGRGVVWCIVVYDVWYCCAWCVVLCKVYTADCIYIYTYIHHIPPPPPHPYHTYIQHPHHRYTPMHPPQQNTPSTTQRH